MSNEKKVIGNFFTYKTPTYPLRVVWNMKTNKLFMHLPANKKVECWAIDELRNTKDEHLEIDGVEYIDAHKHIYLTLRVLIDEFAKGNISHEELQDEMDNIFEAIEKISYFINQFLGCSVIPEK
jgi:hypothetical protein